MTTGELREKTTDELRSLMRTWQEDLFNARFQHYNGQLENTQKLPNFRRDLARVATLLHERELGLARKSPAPRLRPDSVPKTKKGEKAEGLEKGTEAGEEQ